MKWISPLIRENLHEPEDTHHSASEIVTRDIGLKYFLEGLKRLNSRGGEQQAGRSTPGYCLLMNLRRWFNFVGSVMEQVFTVVAPSNSQHFQHLAEQG